jgi:hypothetical protein
MNNKELAYVENELIKLGCPVGIATTQSIRIIRELHKADKNVLDVVFSIKDGVLNID